MGKRPFPEEQLHFVLLPCDGKAEREKKQGKAIQRYILYTIYK
jgi:hypothetical protein